MHVTYTVDTECGDTCLSTDRGNLLNNTTLWRLLSHGGHGLPGNINKAEEVDFYC